MELSGKQGILTIAAAAALLSIGPAPLSGQWLHYPTARVPKTAGGQPNLEAPGPRAVDGHPDLSGLWRAEKNRPCPPEGCVDMEIGQEFLDFGWSLPGGLPFQPWAAALRKARMADNGKDDQTTHCLPQGVPRLHASPFLRKYVQTPGLLAILNELSTQYRQIFTDGRPMPVDPQPAWTGYSIGHWEGDTLVVHTAGLRDGQWLDRDGSPITDAAKVTERFHRLNYGRMDIEVTVDDSKAYTRPWTVTLHQFIVLNTDFVEDNCLENEKDFSHLIGK
ncbi:MAG: hypothetical protein LAP40_19615 [Acidobacteriia bacterium]|nr:hypothetical protein [Terriglobia bacterium]